jgi:hypothetical protein
MILSSNLAAADTRGEKKGGKDVLSSVRLARRNY